MDMPPLLVSFPYHYMMGRWQMCGIRKTKHTTAVAFSAAVCYTFQKEKGL
jgi:hypothetical protein